mgnify:CR=1 FL=1
MPLIPQILATITAIAGCVLVFNQIRFLRMRQGKEITLLREKLASRANGTKIMRMKYQDAHRQFMRQLEQEELYYEPRWELDQEIQVSDVNSPPTSVQSR